MPDLGSSRRKLKVAIGAMLAADLIAAAVLFSPLVGSADSRRLQINELKAELTMKTRDVMPLRHIDQKLVLAKGQIGGFYKDRFAAKDSDLANELGKLAAENGIHIQQARYKQEDAETSGIVPVEIEGSFAGDYLQLVRFINSLERDQLFFIVDSVELGSEHGGVVQLQMKLETYLKTGTT